jgi:DNA helicase-2/ATP-dependent DNA helicase PcrA
MRYPLTVTKRCGKEIVRWARWVIEGDPDRLPSRAPLTPDPDAPDGEVGLLAFTSQTAEANGIAELIEHLIKDENIDAGQILVLFRADRAGLFSTPIKEQLESRGIPIADPDIVKRALNKENNRWSFELARLLARSDDSLAWASLLVLTPGVGNAFVDFIYKAAAAARLSFSEALLGAFKAGFPEAPRSARLAESVIADILEWLGAHPLPSEPPEDGWGHWLTDLMRQVAGRTFDEDLAEIVVDLDDIVDLPREPTGGWSQGDLGAALARFLGQIQPLGADLGSARSDGVRFMSMASSKGLTVQATIVAAVEEGVIPRPTVPLAEERRLLYVAMTRARSNLYCAWSRRRYGPTARAGRPNVGERRTLSPFLAHGPVQTSDGGDFLRRRCPS